MEDGSSIHKCMQCSCNVVPLTLTLFLPLCRRYAVLPCMRLLCRNFILWIIVIYKVNSTFFFLFFFGKYEHGHVRLRVIWHFTLFTKLIARGKIVVKKFHSQQRISFFFCEVLWILSVYFHSENKNHCGERFKAFPWTILYGDIILYF